MSNRKRNQVFEEFIDLYKSEPCLWRVKSKDYHDRGKRDAAYAKLLRKLKESDPDAVKDSVIKKINNMRSNVRKEKKKCDAAKRSGAATDDLYKPTLWYYDLFDFLGDQDIPSTSISNLDDDDDDERSGSDDDNVQETQQSLSHSENVNDVAGNNDEFSTPPAPHTNERAHITNSRPNTKKKNKSDDLTTDVLVSVRDHFKRPQTLEDRYDLMGKTIALRVRGLGKRQRLIAEKMINDILFEAEMGSLSTPPDHHNFGYMDHQARTSFTTHSETPSPTSYNSPPLTNPSPPFQIQPVRHSGGLPPVYARQQINEPLDAYQSSSHNTAESFLSTFSVHN